MKRSGSACSSAAFSMPSPICWLIQRSANAGSHAMSTGLVTGSHCLPLKDTVRPLSGSGSVTVTVALPPPGSPSLSTWKVSCATKKVTMLRKKNSRTGLT